MLSDILKLGDKIDITHLDKYGKTAYNARTYVSQLIDFADFDVIHIATPIASSTPIILNVGENYNLCFYTSKGLFQCNCIILKNQREKNIIIAVVRIITNLEKVQRRQFFRLECTYDFGYRAFSREEEILDNKLKTNDFYSDEERKECSKRLHVLRNTWTTATTKDISGGGMRFISTGVHEQGDNLQLKLELAMGNGIKSMMIGAVIIFKERVINRTGLFEYRVEYNDIAKRDREDIIKFIFEQERKHR